MQAGGKKKVFAGGDTVHLSLKAFEELLNLLGRESRAKQYTSGQYSAFFSPSLSSYYLSSFIPSSFL
jgi:hypothetical protein